jgi:hypothetical protein
MIHRTKTLLTFEACSGVKVHANPVDQAITEKLIE